MIKSAEIVGSLDDILIQILTALPVKSLMCFKSVSKKWKLLITSPRFSLMRNPLPNSVVGLFIPVRRGFEFEYISFDGKIPTNPPFRKLNFPNEHSNFCIQQSCNGLLLCCSSGNSSYMVSRSSPIRICYIYNPTTHYFTKLPRPGVLYGVPRIVLGVNLAFTRAKSPSYKVVCVRGSEFARELFQVEIYSSESGEWRVSGEPFSAAANFDYGVYWNSSIHWMEYLARELLYFNVDEEKFGKMSLPGEADIHSRDVKKIVLGESRDHLHLIERYDAQMAFSVYEMRRDYSEWFVMYQIDLTRVGNGLDRTTEICVYSLICCEGAGTFLVLHSCGKAIKFNIESNTSEEICDMRDDEFGFRLSYAYEHIESIDCV